MDRKRGWKKQTKFLNIIVFTVFPIVFIVNVPPKISVVVNSKPN